MHITFEDKVVVITGAVGGLGSAMCRRFGAEKKSGAPSKSRLVAGAAKNLDEKQEKRVRRVIATRRTIVFGFSLCKVSGFATKPNTLMLRTCRGRRMRFRSSPERRRRRWNAVPTNGGAMRSSRPTMRRAR